MGVCNSNKQRSGFGFQRINTMCREYGVALPEFTEIGDKYGDKFKKWR